MGLEQRLHEQSDVTGQSQAVDADGRSTLTEWRSANSARTRGSKRRVLVVDDVAEAREMYCECLALHGLLAESAEDGASGLAKAAADGPDVIVLDFSMPYMDGGEVLRRLRANERTRSIPVVLVTAMLELVDSRVLGSCAAFLEKPCDPDRLVNIVLSLLESRGPQSARGG